MTYSSSFFSNTPWTTKHILVSRYRSIIFLTKHKIRKPVFKKKLPKNAIPRKIRRNFDGRKSIRHHLEIQETRMITLKNNTKL